jgi:hypothetical protein
MPDPRHLVLSTGRAKVQKIHKSAVRARPKPGRGAAYWKPGPIIILSFRAQPDRGPWGA